MEQNNHWINIPLENLTVHVIGGDWGKESDFIEDEYEAVACIRGSEFKHWKIEFGSSAVIRKIKISSLKTRELLKGDILVEISGGGPEQPVGRTVLISDIVLQQHNLPIVCTNFIRMMRLTPCINPAFVNRYLELFYLSGEVIKYQGGSNNLRNLKFKDYSKINIPLPSLAEQKIITDKLDNLLARVESIRTRLEIIPEILKKFRQSVLSAAVSGKLTEEWRIEKNISINSWCQAKASDVCLKVQSGSTPSGDPFNQKGTIPFLKVYNIVNQEINFTYKPQFIKDDIHSTKCKRSIAYPNDVLMNIVGPPLGKVAILTDQYPEWNINQAITLFRANEEKLFSQYLYYVLCEGDLVRKVMPDTKGTVGQVNISLTQCRDAIIPCPSLEEQREIIHKVENIFDLNEVIRKQIDAALVRINNLTQSILAKAFRGELTAQWREENPELISGLNSAEALLEKITAEKLAAGTIKKRAKKLSH